jgi:hypothetical protein
MFYWNVGEVFGVGPDFSGACIVGFQGKGHPLLL